MASIRWKNASPYCWEMTTDGKEWKNLKVDNEEDSSEAIDEASERTGIPTNQWDLQE